MKKDIFPFQMQSSKLNADNEIVHGAEKTSDYYEIKTDIMLLQI